MSNLSLWQQVAFWIIVAAVAYGIWPLYGWVSKWAGWIALGIVFAIVVMVDRGTREDDRK